MIRFSIVIVTQNRSELLEETLLSFLGLDGADAGDYEILVVDNLSTDGTQRAVEGLTPRFQGRLRYLRESRKGIPFARNRGIQEARGEVIVFVDDDCVPAPDYLTALRRIFDGLDPAVGFVGGKIDPLLINGAVLPEWHTYPFFWGPLAVLDYGPEPWTMTKKTLEGKTRTFYTANMAVRKSIFERFGGIDERQLFAGDTELCIRLVNNGVPGEYRPDLVVSHKISPERISPARFRHWHYLRGQFRELTFNYEPRWYYPGGVPLWLLRRITYFFILSLLAPTFGRRLELRCNALFLWGQAVKILRERPAARPPSR